jgi:NADPH2:quinone reductase
MPHLFLVAAKHWRNAFKLVRQGGRIAFPYGVIPQPRERSGINVIGYDLKAGPGELTRMTQLLTNARPRVPIAAIYPLDEVVKAHQRLQEGHVLGKIVLRLKLTT